MRTNALRFLAAVLATAALAGCNQPAFIELEPKEHTFKRVGEDVWWKARARTRQNKYIHTLTVQWVSSDPKVVTVDAKGRAKAVGTGQATLTATFKDLKAEAVVNVEGVSKVTVEPKEGLTLEARGEGKPIVIKVFDLKGKETKERVPIARCQNEDICRVFGSEVKGVDSGETTLEVTCEGAKDSIPIRTTPTEEERIAKGIDVDPPEKPVKKPKKK